MQDPTGFALADLLLGIGAAEEIEKGAPTQKCPVCGFTQADFKKTGRLGCSECYQTFREGLGTLLKAMHKGTEHVGKMPERAARQMELTDKMRALNDHLREGGGGGKLRNGRDLARPDQATRTRDGELTDEVRPSHVERRGMAARRRSAPPDRGQQPRAARAQSAPSLFPRLGEKGGAHPDSRTDQAARRRAAGDAGRVFRTARRIFPPSRSRSWSSATSSAASTPRRASAAPS